MTVREKTTIWGFGTLTTNLATNTTLGTSTRNDFAAITIYAPETSSRTFRSVIVRLVIRDQSTTATNIAGVRVGIKLGAAAFSDTDYTPTAQANTGDPESFTFEHDVTSYFTSNFGAGTSQTCQVGVAVSTAAASNVSNISVMIFMTYSADDSAATHIKTLVIPIQSHHTTLTNVMQEFGTTGGTANAPANQIPQLTGVGGFIAESSVTIRQAFIRFMATDAGAAVTDFNLAIQVDSGGTINRTTLEAGFNGSAYFEDIWIYDTATYSTTSAHALKLSSSTTGRFQCIGALMYVTYEFDPTSASIENQVTLPLQGGNFPMVAGTTTGDAEVYWVDLWVEEPTTITLKQSGLVLHYGSPSGGTLNMYASSQTSRAYTFSSLVLSGPFVVVHRTDHSSSTWTLSRGFNRLYFSQYTSTTNAATFSGGYAVINYRSGKAAAGCGAHNRTCTYFQNAWLTSGSVSIYREISAPTMPTITPTKYWIQGVMLETVFRSTASFPFGAGYEVLANEWAGDGWVYEMRAFQSDGELGPMPCFYDFTRWFNENDFVTGKMNIETARKLRYQTISTGPHSHGKLHLTYHEITFTVSGTVSDYADLDGAGLTVNVYSNETTSTGYRRRVASTTTSAGGTYSATVYDSANTHFAEVEEDATHTGRSVSDTPT